MSTLTKVFIVLVFLISAGTLGIVSNLFSERVDWKDKWIKEVNYHAESVRAREKTIVALELEKKNLTDGLKKQKEEIDLLNTDIQAKEREIENLRKDQEFMKLQYEQLVAEQQRLVNMINMYIDMTSQLREQLAQAIKDKEKAEADAQMFKQQLFEAGFKLDNVEKMLAETERKAYELSQALEKYKQQLAFIKDRYPNIDINSVTPSVAIEGLVAAVDVESGLVVLNVGKDHGVKWGDEFSIRRDDKFIAVVIVEQVERDHSVARIKVKKEDPRVGDKATNTALSRSDIIERKDK